MAGSIPFASAQDRIELNNGTAIPCIGFGTYKTTENTEEICLQAIRAGYRMLDTAAAYRNEEGVGAAVRHCGLPREELFVTSKVWNTERGYDRTTASFKASLERTGLDYLDLFLIHWPANRKQFGDEARRINADTWRALEDLYEAGLVRAIGVSNFLVHHLEELIADARIMPAVDQIELHPGFSETQLPVVEFCRRQGIAVEAWSPLGRRQVLESPEMRAYAEKYGRTPAQVCIRWVMQHGAIPMPKSGSAERMASNLQVFDFAITPEDMEAMDALTDIGGCNLRPDEVDI